MSKSGLIPYIDLIVPKRRAWQPGLNRSSTTSGPPSHSQTPEPPSPNPSPRKRRKPDEESLVKLALPNDVMDVQSNLQLSPTASEFTYEDVQKLPSRVASSSKTHLLSDSQDEDDAEGDFVYRIDNNDCAEDGDFIMPGETPRTDNDDKNSIPVRLLNDFVIYNAQTFQAIPIAELTEMHLGQNIMYGASGVVKPWILPDDFDEPEDEDDQSDKQDSESSVADQDRITLSRILEFNIHSPPEDNDEKPDRQVSISHFVVLAHQNGYFDSKIYIRTKFSWYILGIPSKSYNPLFWDFWLKHRLLHLLIVAALEDHKLTCEAFIQNLRECDRNEESVVSTQEILGRELSQDDMNEETQAYIISCLPDLCKQNGIQISQVPAVCELTLCELLDNDSSDHSSSKGRRRRRKGDGSMPPKGQWKKETGASKTYLTPIVSHIAQDFFQGSLEVAESMLEHDETLQKCDHKGHEANPKKIVWGKHLGWEKNTYQSVVVDGITYQKCNITFLNPGDNEVYDQQNHDTNDFHCGEEYAEFLDIPPEALVHDLTDGSKSCYACNREVKINSLQIIENSQFNTIIVCGLEYHINEFIYIRPTGLSKVLDIGQIKKIDQLQIHVHLLGRFDDYVHYQKKKPSLSGLDNASFLICDERHLFFTNDEIVVSAHQLDGKCHVSFMTEKNNIQRWIKHDDHYYVNQEGDEEHLTPMNEEDVKHCKICRNEDRERRMIIKKFGQTNSKLVGMELFSGAGGLGAGMDLSGFVETKYAVELWPSAAKTYKTNHPNVTVYCQDSSNLLKHAVEKKSGKKSEPLKSYLDGKSLPPLPDSYEKIDFIFGGPPCQSFSQANHTKQRDDIRTTMPCNMLSYVEHYEPNYFLLENVAGFLDHKLHDMHETEAGLVECEIKFGMVKLVMRTLISLGYQVRFRLLQAGQYGVPQSRRRVIFWGAKRGLPMPKFPVPVYAFPKGNTRITLPTGKMMDPPTRSRDPDEFHHLAPLQPITVLDAISDLPQFDWQNPHTIIPPSSNNYRETRDRKRDGIAQCDAVSHPNNKMSFCKLPGYPEGGTYTVRPQNRYQMWLRERMDKDEDEEKEPKVTGHYTTTYASHVVEASQEPMATAPNGTLHHFSLSPGLSKVMPQQKRMITVREAARAQGFPDHYIFESTGTTPSQIILDQYKMIGNAVAVPLALALGKELGKAMIKAWEKKQREGSPVL
ncbi:hypothetical protein NLJ89_g1982 [Agrocybe chaxingu]|uniref:Cytosine-specific methyltransferase n=1 Tax=Agrocybe chaxingu TaxID=84603 RepID=A0A9W8MZ06_9AGAR|nr:hypothetical protein NLJ89_g1982 [Agrocybe chaxingu]